MGSGGGTNSLSSSSSAASNGRWTSLSSSSVASCGIGAVARRAARRSSVVCMRGCRVGRSTAARLGTWRLVAGVVAARSLGVRLLCGRCKRRSFALVLLLLQLHWKRRSARLQHQRRGRHRGGLDSGSTGIDGGIGLCVASCDAGATARRAARCRSIVCTRGCGTDGSSIAARLGLRLVTGVVTARSLGGRLLCGRHGRRPLTAVFLRRCRGRRLHGSARLQRLLRPRLLSLRFGAPE